MTSLRILFFFFDQGLKSVKESCLEKCPQMPAYFGLSVKGPKPLRSWFISHHNVASGMTECLAQHQIPCLFCLFPVTERDEGPLSCVLPMYGLRKMAGAPQHSTFRQDEKKGC